MNAQIYTATQMNSSKTIKEDRYEKPKIEYKQFLQGFSLSRSKKVKALKIFNVWKNSRTSNGHCCLGNSEWTEWNILENFSRWHLTFSLIANIVPRLQLYHLISGGHIIGTIIPLEWNPWRGWTGRALSSGSIWQRRLHKQNHYGPRAADGQNTSN